MKPDPVIVRQWKDNGELVALFPCDPASTSTPDLCDSLAWDGWSAADPAIVYVTRPVSDEVALKFLRDYRYSLPYATSYRVMRKMSRAMHAERERRWRNA